MDVLIPQKPNNASVWIEIFEAKQRTQIHISNFAVCLRPNILSLPHAISSYIKKNWYFSFEYKTHYSSLLCMLEYNFSSKKFLKKAFQNKNQINFNIKPISSSFAY